MKDVSKKNKTKHVKKERRKKNTNEKERMNEIVKDGKRI